VRQRGARDGLESTRRCSGNGLAVSLRKAGAEDCVVFDRGDGAVGTHAGLRDCPERVVDRLDAQSEIRLNTGVLDASWHGEARRRRMDTSITTRFA
jgi:hypothetical protein